MTRSSINENFQSIVNRYEQCAFHVTRSSTDENVYSIVVCRVLFPGPGPLLMKTFTDFHSIGISRVLLPLSGTPLMEGFFVLFCLFFSNRYCKDAFPVICSSTDENFYSIVVRRVFFP